MASLQRRVLHFRQQRAWGPFHTPKNLAMAIGIEAAELQELFLWKKDDEIVELLSGDSYKTRIQDELADIFIFLLYLGEAVGIDLSEAMKAKLIKNEEKYPVAKSFGNSKKYSELE
ncbi:MAG TPA: nucleotide pyrophosphohydrolase [Desulfobacterales bacterium]|nr:nucleotide pyrophosphohydrolase [Desulfobacterales bacterium]